MISFLRGVVVEIDFNKVTFDVNGVGYQVTCTTSALTKLKSGIESALTIYTDVREDNISLYGFADKLEKQVFLLLTKVKGLGAKSSAELVSNIDKIELLRIIGKEDITALQKIKGIGKKTAERIVIELRDQMKLFANSYSGFEIEKESIEGRDDAVNALITLGVSRKNAEIAVDKVTNLKSIDTGEIVKEALRYI